MIDLNPKYTNKDHPSSLIGSLLVESEYWSVDHMWSEHKTSTGFTLRLCNIPKCGQSTQMTQSINEDEITTDRCIALLREPLARFKSCLNNCSMLFSDYVSSNYNKSKDVMFHMLPQTYFVNAFPYEILEFHDITYMATLYDSSFTIRNPGKYDTDWVEDFDNTYKDYKNWFEDTYQADIELYNNKILGV